MMRLIDADALMFTDFEIIMCDGDFKEAFKLLIEKIENAPSVDIVQCNECIHYIEINQPYPQMYCTKNNLDPRNDFFCKYGERRADEVE